MEEKCRLCEATEDIIDIWTNEYNNILDKIQAVTDSERKYGNWLRYMCARCKNQLDDLWDFRIRCKNAYRTFLDEVDELTEECEQSSYVSEEDDKTIVDTVSNERDNDPSDLVAFEEVLVPIDHKTVEKSRKKVQKIKRKRYKKSGENEPIAQETGVKITAVQHVKIDRRLKQFRAQNLKPKMEPIICSHCERMFKSKNILKRHINVTHLKLLPFLCKICGKKFSSILKLTQHEETHDENRLRIPCTLCNKTFTLKKNLIRHMGIHLEPAKRRVKAHICKHCGESFNGRDAFVQHLKDYSGSSKLMYPCDYCEKEFKTAQRLKHHERVHTGERPYTCEICTKSFKQLAHLQRHLNMHAGERSYPCNFCDKVFTTNGNRTVHMRIHTGETPYECSNCGRKFRDIKMCKNHVSKCIQSVKLDKI